MSTPITLALIIFLAPLAAFAFMAFLHRKLPRAGDWLATGVMGLGLILALALFVQAAAGSGSFFHHWTFDWLPVSGDVTIQGGVLLDGLTAIMLVVVTLVSFLVHLFSIKYMEGDVRYGRYFASLLLFSMSMLGLVLADNILFLFIFWELVGLSSYVLIGHWFEKKSASDAAIKAFITTRIGDVGMLIGLLICWDQVGSVKYVDIFRAVELGLFSDAGATPWLTLAGIGLFLGAMGKSAQFPFHVWLPDAMEGPTPVSALIHAATMVAAGVYLVGRLFPMFTPNAFIVVAYIGAITALFAATIATVQDDIKKVLAYSTLSQLGYMMLALGVGGYFAGLFHLTTHAFFKAGLFLGSGSVIHAMHHEQRMSKYGGLWSKMPKTSWTYLICVLAICGVFPFAGFFSKDAILAAALQWSMDHPAHWFLAFAGFFTALLTAYYMFRQFFMTFTGKPRDEHAFDRAHESPWQMTTPLIVLAFLALVSGWPGGKFEAMLPPSERAALIELYESRETAIASGASGIQIASLDATPFLQEPLAPAAEAEHAEEEHGHGAAHWIAMGLSILLAALGIVIAMATYWDRFTYFKIDPARWVRVFPINAIHKVLWNKYFFDEIYGFVLVGGSMVVMRAMAAFDKWIVDGIVNLTGFFGQASGFLIGIFDNWAVDGAVNGFAKLTGFAGDRLSYTTTGKIRNYLLFVTLGVVALTAVLIFMVRGAI